MDTIQQSTSDAGGRNGAGRVSIVAPAYNEAANLAEFVRQIADVMKGAGVDYEIVFVNDGSVDATLSVMRALSATNEHITVVDLSRNFGKEVAMTAGIAHATGDAVIIIDTDLQDPPSLMLDFIAAWRQGFDVVYAQRLERDGESWLKKATATAFYRVMQKLGPVVMPRDTGDFRLMSRRVAEVLLMLPEQHRFMKGLYAWVGFSQKAVPYHRHARFAGQTKWNYWRLWNLAIEGITSYTIAPLKFASYLGVLTAILAGMWGLWIVIRTLIFGDPVAGFPTLMAAILALGGIQLLVLGVLGEYVGRIFNETKRRPLYLVDTVMWARSADPAGQLKPADAARVVTHAGSSD